MVRTRSKKTQETPEKAKPKPKPNKRNLKRKSPSAAVFELDDDDLSPENSEHEPDAEAPLTKIQKIELIEQNKVVDMETSDKVDTDNKQMANEEKSNENAGGQVETRGSTTTITTETVVESVCEIKKMEDTDTVDSCCSSRLGENSANVTQDSDKIIMEENVTQTSSTIIMEENSANATQNSSTIVTEQLSETKTLEEGEISKVEDESPHICIKFKNSDVAQMYRDKFVKFLDSFIELTIENTSEADETVLNIARIEDLNPSEWVVVDSTQISEIKESVIETPKSEVKKKKNKKKKKVEKELFTLDTAPTSENNVRVNLETRYSTKFMIDEKKEVEDVVSKKPNIFNMCFNCGEEHNLRDCTVAKDRAKIEMNRKKFSNAKAKSTRYHLEEDQKYSHLKPGTISDNLRKALGLQKHQMPPHIYQMRVLGYPPGWLEEAKFLSSNLTLFGIDGKDVASKTTVKKRGLDPAKIVDYPGFNVPLEEGYKDEYNYYRVPRYSEDYGKEKMIEYFKNMEDDTEASEMELDQGSSQDNSEVELKHRITIENTQIRSSPSLKDLETEKKELLAQLNTNNDDSQEDARKSPSESMMMKSAVMSSFGTPILKSSSPYSTLPNPENFMKDVSPVINFENLPNSTGKYEQMTGLLQKVRSTLKNKTEKA